MSFSDPPNNFNPIRVVDPGSHPILDHHIRPGGTGITWDDLNSPPPLPSAGNMPADGTAGAGTTDGSGSR
jgi:hypothetical protein